MKLFHKEGKTIIANTVIYLLIFNGILYFLSINEIVLFIINILSLVFFALVLNFFRNPKRVAVPNENCVYAPVDGKVVVIEETQEDEYFKDRRIQVSVFMSPINVHVSRMPIGGEVTYYRYHPGLYLVAWHPKSSTENERTTVVVETTKGVKILLRQIAGAVARRIVCYAREGEKFNQGDDYGFIKFGSRVDVFLPIGTKINVKIGDVVNGNITSIAELQ